MAESFGRRNNLRFQVCIVGDSLKKNEAFIKSVECFKYPIVYSSSELELINQGGEFTTIYILDEFEGEVFTKLHKAGQRILGPTTVMQYAKRNEALPNNIRPLYTTSMTSTVITFTGFRVKEEVSRLASLIHFMGGSVRKEFHISKTTHVIATETALHSEKYKYAVSLGIPIMSPKWVYRAWEERHDASCSATSEQLMCYKLLPFVGSNLAFVGFKSNEEQHMTEITIQNGGEVTDPQNDACTHIIIENGYTLDLSEFNEYAVLLKSEWFWACIQMEAKAEENLYFYEHPSSTQPSTALVMPVRGNKRQRLERVALQLALESQENDLANLAADLQRNNPKLSLSSGSFLDATLSPDKAMDDVNELNRFLKSPPPPPQPLLVDVRSLSARQQVCLELFQTENNYVGILRTIMSLFKEPLENSEQIGGALLAPAEIKIIFGNLPPIYEIHVQIRTELTEIFQSWREDHSIGNVILNHAHELEKYYPPFVNFFEKTKEVLNTCDASKPRFHAFLKRCQSKPECGRQSLQELLIRPVQRLPSVILLLNDILKHTPKTNPDHKALENAIEALKAVLLHINEDKRKTEGQVEMFDIVNDIENCPPNLLSSHRTLVKRVDLQEITELLTKKNGPMTLFLFTDVIELCKKRSRATLYHPLRSPSVSNLTAAAAAKPQAKSYKHLELIALQHIKRVVDVQETEDWRNAMGIVFWCSKELKELMCIFQLEELTNKKELIQTIARQVANSLCKTDTDSLLAIIDPNGIDVPNSENIASTLSKAFCKTRCKLGRALSLKKTPTKRALSRAISTIISPARRFTTSNNTMVGMKLQSVTNLTEFAGPCPGITTPSPILGKKQKSCSYGAAVAKHL